MRKKLLSPVLFFFIVTLCLYAQQEPGSPETKIKCNRNKTLIDVRLNGVLIEDILLDTGFAFDGLMIYNPAYTDSIDTGNATRVTIGGAGDGEAPTALMFRSGIETGNLALNNHNILLLESDIYKGFPSNGIIGHSLFGHYMPEIDYDKQKMILHKPGSFVPGKNWIPVPIFFKDNNIPWIKLDIDIAGGNPVNVSGYIDFAAGDELVLLKKEDMKYALPDKMEDIYIGRGLRGDIYGKQGQVKEIRIGGLSLNDITVSVADAASRSKQDNADLIIGNGLLKRFNIIFDYRGGKLYLAPNNNFPGKNLQQ